MASFGYHTLDETSYGNALYPFILNVETVARTVNLTPYDDGSGNLTIGVGFNLLDTNVRNAVLDEILYPDGMPDSTVQAADATYRSQLVSAIGEGDIDELNSIMLARSGDGAIDYIPKYTSFAFASAGQAEVVFDNIQSIYDGVLNSWTSSIPESSERIALFSLAYNQRSASPLLGTLLHNALINDNRAEAWYEIRYGSNGNDLDGVAKRRYYESQEFGLYNPGSLDLTEARQIFQMVTHHASNISSYDATYGSQVALANSDYAVTSVQTTLAALTPAKEFLVNTYAPGASIDKIWITFAATVGGSESTTLDYHTGTTNTLLIGSAGNDTITGGSGDDWIVGGAGNNTIDGTSGNDTVSYALAPVGVVVNLETAATVSGFNGYSGTDTFTNIANVLGSAHDDVLTGRNYYASTIYGSLGDDTINAGLYTSSAGGDTTVNYSTLNIDGSPAITVTANGDGTITVAKTTSLGSGTDTINLDVTSAYFAISGTSGEDNFNGFDPAHQLIYVGNAGDTYTFDMDRFDAFASNIAGVSVHESAGGSFNDIHVENWTNISFTTFGGYYMNYTPTSAGISIQYTKPDAIDPYGINTLYLDYEKDVSATSGVIESFTLGSTAYLYGSYFNEVITGATGNHFIEGGPGINTIDYSAATGGATVNLATGIASNGWGYTDTLFHFQNVIGSSHNDTITGDGADNVISGGAGNNTLNGGSGTNTLDYSNDTAGVTVNLSTGTATNGYSGTDTISNFQIVHGSAYNDSITGDSNSNVFAGGGGADALDGGAGTDTVDYSEAATGVTVNLSTGTASNDGDGSSDTLTSIENLTGSAFNDTLTGDGNANVINGADGNDTIQSGAGNDTVNGGAGNDALIGGTGDDSLDGGSGTDTADYTASAGAVTIILSSGTATGEGSDTLSNIENVTGSAFGDQLYGDGAANTLDGGNGNDTLQGGAGNDTILGGAGTDTVYGGAGNDSLDGGTGTNIANYNLDIAGVTVNLSTGTATDGWGNTDTLSNIQFVSGSNYADTITGDANNNTLTGYSGADALDGGGGVNTVNYRVDVAGVTVNLSTGTATDGWGNTDTLSNIQNASGSDYADTITGNSSANVLTGNNGDDIIYGGGGTDSFLGSAGADSLYGGVDNDQYYYSAGNGHDVIHETGGVDILQLSLITLGALSYVKSGNNLVISVDGTGNNDITITDFYVDSSYAVDWIYIDAAPALYLGPIISNCSRGCWQGNFVES
jgi:Ca2+-binding RTX toxin-like protein